MNKLANTLLRSVHAACDLGEQDLARAILNIVEQMLGKFPDGQRRRIRVAILGAHERLAELQQKTV